MKKACIVVDDFYKNNKLFDINDALRNRDNCLYGMYLLKQKCSDNGIDLSTDDINSIEDSIFVIYTRVPANVISNQNACLLLMESPFIDATSWNLSKHGDFNLIFTYKDDIIDNIKYIKVNYSFEISKKIPKDLKFKEKLCVLIAGNKTSHHALELYSKRIEAIRWFENNHPEDFDLYGIGWDEYFFSGPKIMRLLNKSRYLREIFTPHYCSYKGKINKKKEVLERYKFSICYENFRDIPGWITEKIFDCFFSGCVPIYWGANNVAVHIPVDCFIDKRKYHNYDELYSYINNMRDEEYLNYLNNIEQYLNSDRANEFSSEYFVNTIFENIIGRNK